MRDTPALRPIFGGAPMRLITPTPAESNRIPSERPSPCSTALESLSAGLPLTKPKLKKALSTPMSGCWRRQLLMTAALVALTVGWTVIPAAADTQHVVALAASVDQVLTNIRNWIMGILAGLATVFLSIAFVRRIAGGGDPGEMEKSKTAFKSACWGYAGAALAPLVVEILKGIVGA